MLEVAIFMTVHWPARLGRTSENTVVYNLLHDMVARLEQRYGCPVTVISPTTNEEALYGFDSLVWGLPRGRLHAFQFKRPYVTRRDYVTFRIDRGQHVRLLSQFQPRIARYVFCPYPLTDDFVQQRRSVLDYTLFPDVHSVPSWGAKTNRTRTVRLPNPLALPSPTYPVPGITDPRTYDDLPEACLTLWEDIEEIALKTGVETLGKKEFIPKEYEKLRSPIGHIHYVFMRQG